MNKQDNKHRKILTVIIYLALTFVTFGIYFQVIDFDFLNFDDIDYVTANPNVQAGLTLKSVKWAFTTSFSSNWHPVTWLSHMLDCSLFGLNPARHHLTNLLLHIANTLLLFGILRKITGTIWQSAVVAALFALHPLHVESVAWISERKDLLNTLFGLLTIAAYYSYAKKNSLSWYLMAIIAFSLGLMAKPMLVTLPFILLLLDYWPIGRLKFDENGGKANWRNISFLLAEKIPFLILSVISAVVTLIVQQTAGAIKPAQFIPINLRLANALVSYLKYIAKMFYPVGLAAFYPHPRAGINLWLAVISLAALIAITIIVVYLGARRRYLIIGWFWYIISLIPVIGIIQVGEQAMADRYTYIPLIGIFIIVTWASADILTRLKCGKIFISAIAAGVLIALSICSYFQIRYWTNSEMLYERMMKVTANNYPAHYNLGLVLAKKGNVQGAIEHFKKAVEICPNSADAHNNLGSAIIENRGDLDQAEYHFKRALLLNPKLNHARLNLASILAGQGRIDEAIQYYKEALLIDSNCRPAQNALVILRSQEIKN